MMCSRGDVIATARRMATLGLITGTLGNVSCRLGDRVLITPSGMGYETMRPEALVLLDLAGNVVEGDRPPSSEVRLHLAIYARIPDTYAVVHTHSPKAVTAGDGMDELPVGDSAVLRANVPVAPFQPPGTQELADRAVDLLVNRNTNAVILERHGVVGVGRDLDEALEVCRDVERLAGELR